MLHTKVFLTQTDTTIGFISKNSQKLDAVKQRLADKHYIKAVNSLQTLQHFTRVASTHKTRVRRAKKTTFIMPNGYSYRLVHDRHHLLLLNRLTWAYTTSANLSGACYDASFAKVSADIVVEPLQHNEKASRILKLGKRKIQRIR